MRLLAACAFVSIALANRVSPGSTDGRFYVTSPAPLGSNCTPSVTAIGSAGALVEQTVSGSYRESFIAGRSRKGHGATLHCGSAVVAEHSFKYGRDVRFGRGLAISDGVLQQFIKAGAASRRGLIQILDT